MTGVTELVTYSSARMAAVHKNWLDSQLQKQAIAALNLSRYETMLKLPIHGFPL